MSPGPSHVSVTSPWEARCFSSRSLCILFCCYQFFFCLFIRCQKVFPILLPTLHSLCVKYVCFCYNGHNQECATIPALLLAVNSLNAGNYSCSAYQRLHEGSILLSEPCGVVTMHAIWPQQILLCSAQFFCSRLFLLNVCTRRDFAYSSFI